MQRPTLLLALKKGPWTREEDQKLLAYVKEHGHGNWRTLPAQAGLERCGKSCRMRWTNYLRPDIKRGKFSTQEEKTIIRLHALLGNRWSAISAYLPKRTDNEIKNYWNTRLKKRLTRMGIDPVTHKPKNTQATNVTHMAQWETARLEAESRLVHKSNLLYNLQLRLKKFGPPPSPPQPVATTPYLDVLKVWQATNTQNRFFSPKIDGMSMHGSSKYVEQKGKMENSMLVHDINIVETLDYNKCNNMMMDPMDFSTDTHNFQSDDNIIGGEIVEDMVMNDSTKYWMELLKLVGSSMESPIFQI